ncbi:MAG: YeeE/YedE family protein [Pseudomonadales bacterium]|nr:YeeE/YedE family protein [Pseudomonadales bacterium]
MSLTSNLSALFGGTIFGAGLVVSGMTDPEKVLAFLTLGAGWDPALIFVMGSAVVVATLGFWLVGKRAAPLFDTTFHAPASTALDGPLLGGAVLFGVGWGVSGFCPGPALVGVMTLDERALLFIVAYGVGVLLFEKLVSPRLQPVVMQAPSAVDG